MLEAALAREVGFAPRRGWDTDLQRAADVVAGKHRLAPSPIERIATDARLVREIAENIAVGESYFFRQPLQLELACTHLEGQINAGRRPSVWSAGCARGEELLSLIALLWDHHELGDRVQAFGTDLCGEWIRQAHTGEYSDWSLRTLSPAYIDRYFTRTGGGKFRVARRLHDQTRFNHRTIQDELERLDADTLDVILFRNVGIYLTEDACTRMLQGMQAVLRPGGKLFLAPTDPLPDKNSCPELERVGVGIYRRRLDGDRVQVNRPPCAAERKPAAATRQSGTRQPALRQSGTRQRAANVHPLPATPRTRQAPTIVPDTLPLGAAGAAEHIRHAYALADAGRLPEALAALDALLLQLPGDEHAHLARGRVWLAAGQQCRALDDFRVCGTSKAPSIALIARYYCTICLTISGRSDRAGAELDVLLRELLGLDPEAMLDGGYRAGELLDAVRSDLRRLS